MRVIWEELKENLQAESERWIGWVPVLFGLGIGIYFLLPTEPPKWVVVAVVEFLLLCVFLFRKNTAALALISILLIISLGFADIFVQAQYAAQNIEKNYKEETTYLKGRIVKIDRSYRGKVRLSLSNVEDYDKPRRGEFRVTLSAKQTDLKEGECVEMIATLMPDFLPVLPETYQFGRKAFFEGVSAFGYVNSNVFVTGCQTDLSLSQKISYALRTWRNKIVAEINKYLAEDEAGIAAAVIAGERSGISHQISENYRNSGLAHFLAISGLHMSMIAGMAFFALRLILALIPQFSVRYNSKKAAAVLAIFVSFVYLLISGGAVSTQRAFIMTFVVLLGILFNRAAISMRMISLAAVIVLIISPQALISAGFQMSFAAVTVLVAFYERFASAIHQFFAGKNLWQITLAYIAGLLISDLMASLATLPFAIYHFNQIAVYTTLGNLLAGPIIGLIIMPFVLLSLFLMPFGWSGPVLKIVGYGIMAVNAITAWVAHLPGAGFKVMSMPLWGLLCLVFGGLWLCIWTTKWRRWGLIPLIVGVLSLLAVEKPDFLFDREGQTIGVKDQSDNIIIMPESRNRWIRQVWLEKTVSRPLSSEQKKELRQISDGVLSDPDWLDLKCDQAACVYKGRIKWSKAGDIQVDDQKIDTYKSGGGVVYLDGRDYQLQTICDDVGERIWNSCGKF